MRYQVVEVVYGRHCRYEVVRSVGLFQTSYFVRRDDGRSSGSFAALVHAVRWAHEQARKY